MKPSLFLVHLLKALTVKTFKKVVFPLLFSTAFFQLQAQSPAPLKLWDKTLGSGVDDYLKSVVSTLDGGYLLGGYYLQAGEGGGPDPVAGSYDYYVTKTDKDGNKQWDKTYGGSSYDFLFSIANTADSGFLLGGYSLSGIGGTKSEASKGGYDYWIIKIDKNGNKVWDRTYGGNDYDLLYSVLPTDDGGFLLAGNSSSNIGGDKTEDSEGSGDYWIVKIDSSGNKQWDKTYGGADFDNFRSVIKTFDGGYLLGGYTQSGISSDKSDTTRGFYDYWIIKIDSGGNKVWDKTFGGSNLDELTSMITTPDHGFLLGGDSYSNTSGDKTDSLRGFNDYWIIKTDSNGNKQWDKTFGGTGSEYFSSIAATSDGNYYLGGSSASTISGDKTKESFGESDYWIIKIDSSGNKIADFVYGAPNTETLTTIVKTDSSYLLGGQSNSNIGGDKSEMSLGRSDFWLIKISAENVKQPQTILFDSISDHTYGDSAFALTAKASSNLPVQFKIISGPASIFDNTLNIMGAGIISVEASQQGDSSFSPAPSIIKTFQASKATPIISWSPANLIKNEPLGEQQLNATATFKDTSVTGSFTYNPVAGTILPFGKQNLKTDFTPIDTVDFNAVSSVTSTITVLSPPIVSIDNPGNDNSYIAPANINIGVTASDSDGTITKVEFYEGNTFLYADTVAPYAFTLKKVTSGNYALTAKATDNNGLVTTATAVHISVVPNKAPTVSIVSPDNSQTYPGPATIYLEAKADDSDGSITKVEFYNGETLLRTEYKYPYTFTWKDVPIGDYIITAKARDNWGSVTTSDAINISVHSNIAPTVSITNPVGEQPFNTGDTIFLQASAADVDGKIARVEFYNGSTLIRTEYKTPYTYHWSAETEGAYTVTAVAIDDYGNATTSTPVTIKVAAITAEKAVVRNSKTKNDKSANLEVYPNPAREKIRIRISSLQQSKSSTILLISEGGVVMTSQQIPASVRNLEMNVTSLTKGVYMIEWLTGGQRFFRKFLKL